MQRFARVHSGIIAAQTHGVPLMKLILSSLESPSFSLLCVMYLYARTAGDNTVLFYVCFLLLAAT